MAPVDRRLRLWAWIVRHQVKMASMSEADIVALQARPFPDNALARFIMGAVAPEALTEDRAIPGPAGDVAVRIYRPAGGGSGARPLIVNFHGGGFVVGELRMSDWLCSRVAVTVGAVVVSVAYRLAPGHQFPAAVDDCYAALKWAAGQSAELGAGGPAGVMGESAGGTLAAVMGLLARDRGGPAIAHQVLLYPAVDVSRPPGGRPDAPFLARSDMVAYRRLYLGDADPRDERASPLLAADHTGLPPALIQVGEHDPLRDDAFRYGEALRASGVSVRLTEYVGMPHGFLNFPGLCRIAAQALAELCAEQSAALGSAAGH